MESPGKMLFLVLIACFIWFLAGFFVARDARITKEKKSTPPIEYATKEELHEQYQIVNKRLLRLEHPELVE